MPSQQDAAAGQVPRSGPAGKQHFWTWSCPEQRRAAGRPDSASGNHIVVNPTLCSRSCRSPCMAQPAENLPSKLTPHPGCQPANGTTPGVIRRDNRCCLRRSRLPAGAIRWQPGALQHASGRPGGAVIRIRHILHCHIWRIAPALQSGHDPGTRRLNRAPHMWPCDTGTPHDCHACCYAELHSAAAQRGQPDDLHLWIQQPRRSPMSAGGVRARAAAALPSWTPTTPCRTSKAPTARQEPSKGRCRLAPSSSRCGVKCTGLATGLRPCKRWRMTSCTAMQNVKLYSADTTVCLIPQSDGNLVTFATPCTSSVGHCLAM